MTSGPGIGFIGAGRIARALARGLAQRGHRVVACASRSAASAERLAGEVPGCTAVPAGQTVVNLAELVFLTVPDDAIATAAASLAWSPGKSVVHCSGATEVSALAPAADQGAAVGGFHPLQTFADPAVALAGLPGCTVAIEADGALSETLHALAAALGTRPIRLPPGCRALYHCAGGFAATYVDVLLHEAAGIWQSFGVGPEQSLPALIALTRGTLDSIARDGTVRGLAGPISRGDVGTVERHLLALSALPPETRALYVEMSSRAIPLALAKGTLAPERAEVLRKLFDRD